MHGTYAHACMHGGTHMHTERMQLPCFWNIDGGLQLPRLCMHAWTVVVHAIHTFVIRCARGTDKRTCTTRIYHALCAGFGQRSESVTSQAYVSCACHATRACAARRPHIVAPTDPSCGMVSGGGRGSMPDSSRPKDAEPRPSSTRAPFPRRRAANEPRICAAEWS